MWADGVRCGTALGGASLSPSVGAAPAITIALLPDPRVLVIARIVTNRELGCVTATASAVVPVPSVVCTVVWVYVRPAGATPPVRILPVVDPRATTVVRVARVSRMCSPSRGDPVKEGEASGHPSHRCDAEEVPSIDCLPGGRLPRPEVVEDERSELLRRRIITSTPVSG